MIEVKSRDQEAQPLTRALEHIDGAGLADSVLKGMIRRGARRQEVVARLRRLADALHGLANEFESSSSGEEYFESRRRQILARMTRFGGGLY
ncbi:MAG: hypothetical protein P8X75_08520 [Limibacillus sp.]|jgi:hypothetical protein